MRLGFPQSPGCQSTRCRHCRHKSAPKSEHRQCSGCYSDGFGTGNLVVEGSQARRTSSETIIFIIHPCIFTVFSLVHPVFSSYDCQSEKMPLSDLRLLASTNLYDGSEMLKRLSLPVIFGVLTFISRSNVCNG